MGEWITEQEKANRETDANQREMLDSMGAVFVMILKFLFWAIPRVIGGGIGLILGLCFKIGFVGKVISTILASAIGVFVIGFLTSPMTGGDGITILKILWGIICLAALGGIAFWWWMKHYEKISRNAMSYTLLVLKRSACIVFYGFAGIGVVFMLLSAFGKIKASGEFLAAIAFTIPFLIAFYFTYLPDMTKPDYKKYSIEELGVTEEEYESWEEEGRARAAAEAEK
jgi:hypothetical protein